MRIDHQHSNQQEQICVLREKINQLMTLNDIREDRINEL